ARLPGVGSRVARAVVSQSGGPEAALVFLVMVAALVLGVGMPTAVVYALLATLVGPALVAMGLTPLSAHFFFFYFGVLAAITPPVALASYAAASIAGSDFDKTGWAAFRIALPSFLVPFFFARNPALLLEGTALEVVQDRKSTRLNSSHVKISYAVFCLKKKSN